MPHPVHLHGSQFQVVERSVPERFRAIWDTVSEGYVDAGWKDTVLLMPDRYDSVSTFVTPFGVKTAVAGLREGVTLRGADREDVILDQLQTEYGVLSQEVGPGAVVENLTITGDAGTIDDEAVGRLCDQVARVRADGRQVIVVTSGAIAAGLPALDLGAERPGDAVTLQAASAVGQSRLMAVYDRALDRHGLVGGQVLLAPPFPDQLLLSGHFDHVGVPLELGPQRWPDVLGDGVGQQVAVIQHLKVVVHPAAISPDLLAVGIPLREAHNAPVHV